MAHSNILLASPARTRSRTSLRRLAIAAVAVACLLDGAAAAPSAADRSGPSLDAGRAAYRAYVKEQAGTLAGMTRILARAIKDGDLETAQLTYAPAHRYLTRIAPLARTLGDLDRRMDARADAFPTGEADPRFSGFHRIEYGLFAIRSTAGLADVAERLDTDARELRTRLTLLDVAPAVLLDGSIETLEAGLSGDEERYARTDLWDVEANVEGARRVAALVQQSETSQAATDLRFAAVDALLETHKVGCGFKSTDTLGREERQALKAQLTALARQLSTLRGAVATD